MHSYKHSLIIIITITVLFLGSCSPDKESGKSDAQQASQAIPQVQVTPALADNPEYTLTLPGELLPYEQVEIYPKVKGFIKALYVDRGSRVKKGQLLALLEAPEMTQQYLADQAESHKLYERYLYSKQNLARLKMAARQSGAVADIEIEKAHYQLRSDSASYAAAQAKTRVMAEMQGYLRIRAPFAGTITDRNVSVGALVGESSPKGTSLFSMAQQGKLRLTVAIPERHSPALQAGTKATFTVSGRPGQVYTSTLSRNGMVVNQAERSVTAEFDVKNQDGALRGGEYAQVRLTLRRPYTTVWVPDKSVVRAQSGIFVLKVQNDQIHRIPVSEGIRQDSLLEVFGEIAPGDLIVQKGTEELAEKTQVEVVSPGKQKLAIAK